MDDDGKSSGSRKLARLGAGDVITSRLASSAVSDTGSAGSGGRSWSPRSAGGKGGFAPAPDPAPAPRARASTALTIAALKAGEAAPLAPAPAAASSSAAAAPRCAVSNQGAGTLADGVATQAAVNALTACITDDGHRLLAVNFLERRRLNLFVGEEATQYELKRVRRISAVQLAAVKGLINGATSAPEAADDATAVTLFLSYVPEDCMQGSTWLGANSLVCASGHVAARLFSRPLLDDYTTPLHEVLRKSMVSLDAASGSNRVAKVAGGFGGHEYRSPSPAVLRAQYEVTGKRMLEEATDRIIILMGFEAGRIIDAIPRDKFELYDATTSYRELSMAATGGSGAVKEVFGLGGSTDKKMRAFWAVGKASRVINLVVWVGHFCATFRVTGSYRLSADAMTTAQALERQGQILRALHGKETNIIAAALLEKQECYDMSQGALVVQRDGSRLVAMPRARFFYMTRAEVAELLGVLVGRILILRTTWGTGIAELYDEFEAEQRGSPQRAKALAALAAGLTELSDARGKGGAKGGGWEVLQEVAAAAAAAAGDDEVDAVQAVVEKMAEAKARAGECLRALWRLWRRRRRRGGGGGGRRRAAARAVFNTFSPVSFALLIFLACLQTGYHGVELAGKDGRATMEERGKFQGGKRGRQERAAGGLRARVGL
jgi:hypothetical protein